MAESAETSAVHQVEDWMIQQVYPDGDPYSAADAEAYVASLPGAGQDEMPVGL